MCTAATYRTKDFYFGRTLDYEISYGDQIVVTPRNYAFPLRNGGELKSHYAMIRFLCPFFAAVILISSIASAFGWISM